MSQSPNQTSLFEPEEPAPEATAEEPSAPRRTGPEPLVFLAEDGSEYVYSEGEYVVLGSPAGALREYLGPAEETRGRKRGKHRIENKSSTGRTLVTPLYVAAEELWPLNDKKRIRERGRLSRKES